MKKLRIGILGTANIGRTNWKAVFNSGNCVVSAVASRDPEKSRRFINECQAEFPFETPPAPLGSYEELVALNNVDAVYIPLPTGLRKEWVLRAAAAGKHVICEKPCGVSFADVQAMAAACRKNHVQFMDGVMFMHSPRLPRVREVLDDGKSVGFIRRISSAFSFCGTDEFSRGNIRMDGRLEPAGCLGDLGWYCIRFALWTMKWRITLRGHRPDSLAIRTDRWPGVRAHRIFCRASFRRQHFRRILLFLYRRRPAMGFCQWPEWLAADSRFRPPVQQPRTGFRGQPDRNSCPGGWRRSKADPRSGVSRTGPCDRPKHHHVPQLRQPGFFRQTQRRMADVGAENAAGAGRVSSIGAGRREANDVGVQALACRSEQAEA